ncbi:MAG: thioesterase family protein [Porticoccaceae bacterium]
MRAEPRELDIRNYAYITEITPRYTDLDTLGHINNVATADLMQETRIHFIHRILDHSASDFNGDHRVVVVSQLLNYLEEIHYPATLKVGVAVYAVGNSSFTLSQLLMQADKPAAWCRCVMVRSENHVSTPIADDIKRVLKQHLLADI